MPSSSTKVSLSKGQDSAKGDGSERHDNTLVSNMTSSPNSARRRCAYGTVSWAGTQQEGEVKSMASITDKQQEGAGSPRCY